MPAFVSDRRRLTIYGFVLRHQFEVLRACQDFRGEGERMECFATVCNLFVLFQWRESFNDLFTTVSLLEYRARTRHVAHLGAVV